MSSSRDASRKVSGGFWQSSATAADAEPGEPPKAAAAAAAMLEWGARQPSPPLASRPGGACAGAPGRRCGQEGRGLRGGAGLSREGRGLAGNLTGKGVAGRGLRAGGGASARG